jgi:sec-independent protein translocase protein TatA
MPGGWEWLIIAGVLLLLFGAKKLPEMARSVGQSARVFKGEMKGLKADDESPHGEPATGSPADPPAGSTDRSVRRDADQTDRAGGPGHRDVP